MAIVINTDTRLFSPVYNKMEVQVFQNDASIRTKPDYRYIFDIKIVDYISGSTVVFTAKVTPDPLLGRGVQDLSGHVEKYIKENIVPHDDTDAIRITDNAVIRYFVEYGEEYRLTANDPIVEYKNLVTGTDKYAFGASLEEHRWIDFYNNSEYLLYLFDTNNQGEFLTNYKTPSVYLTDLGWHWYLSETPTSVDFVRVLTYDSSGVLLGTFDIPNNSVTGLDQSRMNSVATAPQSLNNITGAFLVGAQPVITSSVASYTVQCFQSPSSAVGEILYFTLDSECFYETFRVHFKNEYGAYDSFNFKGNSKRLSDGESKDYTTNANNITSTGLVYSHDTVKKINYYTKYSNRLELESGLINETQLNWLKEMVFSPQLFVEFVDNNGDHNFKPAIIKGSKSWRELKDQVDKVFNFSIELELADNFRQRR